MPDQHNNGKLPSFTALREIVLCKQIFNFPSNSRALHSCSHLPIIITQHNTTYEFDSLRLVACHASLSVYLLTFRGFNLAMKTPSNHTASRDGINYILASLGFISLVSFLSVQEVDPVSQPAANSSLIRRFKFGSWWLEAKRKMF